MKKHGPLALAFGIASLFFIQSAGTLVESIYILDLMNSRLDEKVLGVLFFFTPALLLPFHKKYPRPLAWAMFALLFLSRGVLPYLGTSGRVLAAGLGIPASAGLFLFLIGAKPKGEARPSSGAEASAGLALAILLSVLLRSAYAGLDYSLIPAGGWTGILLGVLLGAALTRLEPGAYAEPAETRRAVTAPVLGIFLVLALAWFAFSAPAVIARWTEGNYTVITIAVSLLSAAAGWFLWTRPAPMPPRLLMLWNLLFTAGLTGTLLVHRVPFPPAPDSPAAIAAAPAWILHLPLALTLLLFPVLFVDLRLFVDRLAQAAPQPRHLVPALLLGGLAIMLLVFANIFTNVWGYVDPVSPPFRGTYWLTYFLLAGGVAWLAGMGRADAAGGGAGIDWKWMLVPAAIVLATALYARPMTPPAAPADPASLVVMTFNTQQSNDDSAERSFDRQLALIRKVSPDVLAMQETDSTRISLNNNDYVRYFAENLGYYSYFGPSTVNGTYGTAILSKYPLENTRTIYSYSDQDEIGTAAAEIVAGGRRITIYDVHPDGSDTAKTAFARALIEQARDDEYAILLGDFNMREGEPGYRLIDALFTEAWSGAYPDGIGPGGLDLSGRIDHIFVSPSLQVRDQEYLPPPDSATDHPVHWAVVYWE